MKYPSRFQRYFSQRTPPNNSRIHLEQEKSPNNGSNPEEEDQSWMHHISAFQTILQTVVIKTVWDQCKNRPVVHNREPRNKPIHTWSTNI